MISTPKMGRLVNSNGKMAQWIAQATEVTIPNASQLTFRFMWLQTYNNATLLQNYC